MVIIPAENASDLIDIPDKVRNGIEIVLVTRLGEVLERALVVLPVEVLPMEAGPVEAEESAEPHEPRDHQAGAVTPLSAEIVNDENAAEGASH